MQLPFRYLRARLSRAGLLPATRFARVTCYLSGLDIALFLIQKLSAALNLSFGKSLGGWITLLGFTLTNLWMILTYRWLRTRLLWRLRNRLIVTYVFIGVIPALLLLSMAGIS